MKNDIRVHVDVMQAAYEENDYPSERLIRDADHLSAFADEFNRRLGTDFLPEEVSAELERIRKSKKSTGGLPKLGRSFAGPKFQ